MFAGTDACVTPVRSFAESEFDPQLASRGTLRRRDGELEAAPAPRFSRSSAADGAPAVTVDFDDALRDWPVVE